jgi:hypothetical protein
LNNRKNQNSILVLATLGVYLGLVLAGATPQVLAQAAMTRQFDVRDEIEAKDDVDRKPDDALTDLTESSRQEIEAKVSASIDRFFSRLSIHSIESCFTTGYTGGRTLSSVLDLQIAPHIKGVGVDIPLRRKIAVTNFPRADLNSLLAS